MLNFSAVAFWVSALDSAAMLTGCAKRRISQLTTGPILPATPCQSGDASAVADLGGSIITGIDGNPLAVLAKQLDIPMHDINSDDVPLYLRDGSQLDQAVDMQVEQTLLVDARSFSRMLKLSCWVSGSHISNTVSCLTHSYTTTSATAAKAHVTAAQSHTSTAHLQSAGIFHQHWTGQI